MLKERQQKEAAKTHGDSYCPFTSDKIAYAVQHPGSINFIWKSNLHKFPFAMIITELMLGNTNFLCKATVVLIWIIFTLWEYGHGAT